MVGVLALSTSPGKPSSRTASPTCMFCKRLMMRLPNTVVITNDNITANATLKVMN